MGCKWWMHVTKLGTTSFPSARPQVLACVMRTGQWYFSREGIQFLSKHRIAVVFLPVSTSRSIPLRFISHTVARTNGNAGVETRRERGLPIAMRIPMFARLPGVALSTEFADATRHHLRKEREIFEHGPRQGLCQRSPR